jgi:hypothetical protein
MTKAGERINTIFDELFVPVDLPDESLLWEQVEGSVWRFVDAKVDLARLEPYVPELVNLFYRYKRDQNEVSKARMLTIGLAFGTINRLRVEAGHEPLVMIPPDA